MKIIYATNVRIPSERAHGRQIAHVCRALWHVGHELEVVAPYRENVVKEDFWTYEHLSRDITLTYVGKIDYIKKHWPGIVKLWAMNRMLRREIPTIIADRHPDVVYTRSHALLPALVATKVPVILELHQIPRFGRRAFVFDCNKCARVACLTSPMRDHLLKMGVRKDVLMVEGDAVDLDRFENLPSKAKARAKWKVKTDRLVVGYVGRLTTLGQEKGVTTLLQGLAATKASKKFFGLIVGGPEEDKKKYEHMATKLGLTNEDMLFVGEIPAADVPSSLIACDMLAMPFPDLPHYRMHMSPLKMFEYMAADRPLLTTDLPTVRDVLDEKTAVFCQPGDTADFVHALEWIAEHPDEAAARAAAAAALVRRHTWQERMERILDGVPSRT